MYPLDNFHFLPLEFSWGFLKPFSFFLAFDCFVLPFHLFASGIVPENCHFFLNSFRSLFSYVSIFLVLVVSIFLTIPRELSWGIAKRMFFSNLSRFCFSVFSSFYIFLVLAMRFFFPLTLSRRIAKWNFSSNPFRFFS